MSELKNRHLVREHESRPKPDPRQLELLFNEELKRTVPGADPKLAGLGAFARAVDRLELEEAHHG